MGAQAISVQATVDLFALSTVRVCPSAAMPSLEVVVNRKSVQIDVDKQDKVGDLMKKIHKAEGIEAGKQVILYRCQEFRMPSYENGKLVVYDGEERTVRDDAACGDFNMDGSEALARGELQDGWLEEVKWGAFGHTLYE